MIERTEDLKTSFVEHIRNLQQTICDALEKEDGKGSFKEDVWQRPGGGGGRTRIMQNGIVFEKGGVNISEVNGRVTNQMKQQLKMEGEYFFAAGISLILHPFNPIVPTVHANFRYFELYDKNQNRIDCWFGGGADLTPYYLIEEDAIHFHQILKNICDRHQEDYYRTFKANCDEYFVNHHRDKEARGIGGIFFDHLRPHDGSTKNSIYQFAKDCSDEFLDAYMPIVQKRKATSFTPRHKYWQEIRRGRYIEFNLIHDRGTLFGLRTKGRTESILMSLPPTARFEYDYRPEPGSDEDILLQVCLQPRNWC